jgi:7-keto-8-aminopelargonate synthetase-like enzyme
MELLKIQSVSGAHMIVDGREMLNFTGCSYLGICSEPALIEAGVEALRRYGSLGQIPRHYGALPPPYFEVEEAAARFFQSEAAMFFSQGYLFASVALQGLVDRYDLIFVDEGAHYAVKAAARAAEKPIVFYRHSDAEDLARKLRENLRPGQRPVVATDGMFPTWGNVPPLDEYWQLVQEYDGWIVVDESHSLGVFGENGRGIVEKFGVPRERVIAGGSLAKAFCAYGAIALGTKECIDALWKSPPARGAAGGMTAAAAMSAAAIKYVEEHPELLVRLRQIIAYIKGEMNAMGIPVGESESPNVTFSLGTPEDMRRIQQALLEENIYIMYSSYIGAPAGGVLRLSLFADHSEEDIDRFLAALKRHMP